MSELRKLSDVNFEIEEEFLKIRALRKEIDKKEVDIENHHTRIAMLIEQRDRLRRLEKNMSEGSLEGK